MFSGIQESTGTVRDVWTDAMWITSFTYATPIFVSPQLGAFLKVLLLLKKIVQFGDIAAKNSRILLTIVL